jgi:hypothetical protein
MYISEIALANITTYGCSFDARKESTGPPGLDLLFQINPKIYHSLFESADSLILNGRIDADDRFSSGAESFAG